ncbi:MAG TPA: DNA-processing protein DprA [Candidatus Saccharimonadales bacterium]|nr:DNA-processing protein DprA [Candidatus Saccharimonadales bacterium]
MIVNTLKLNSKFLPTEFRHIANPPKQLFYRGNLENFANLPRLAVVGSRKASPYGRAVTIKIVSDLASRGIVIISGLALGIDSIAHQAALDADGCTVAVLACGVERIYPKSHYHLANRILQSGGVIISEYPEETEPLGYQFIARNRIISGLSDAVLITEAAEKSGSLHTANFALDQGRTVMAVPGNITSLTSQGTNNLIKAGAIPVTSTDDVLMAMGLVSTRVTRSIQGANEHEEAILAQLRQGITDSAELQIKSQLAIPAFNQTLSMLEITGKIKPLGAGNWRLA